MKATDSHILAIFVVLCLVKGGRSTESLEARRTSLAQLPLEKLLHVKQALSSKGELNEKGDTELVEEDGDRPQSLGQEWRKKKTPLRREEWDWEEETNIKGKDISSIFQSTVTILSFLAFGGYLLCLIVNAVKNGMGTVGGVVTTMPTVAPAAIVGRKRRKRAAEEEMLKTLHRIAEAYVAHSLMPPQPPDPFEN